MLRRILCLLVLMASPALAAREGPLTLEEAVRRAMDRGPAIAVSRARQDTASALVNAKPALPNPELEVEAEAFGLDRDWTRPEETRISVSQTFPLGRRLERQADMDLAALGVATREAEGTAASVALQAAGAFVRAEAAQERAALARDALALAEQTSALVARRVAAGSIPEADTSRSDVELARARLDLETAAGEELETVAALCATWGGWDCDFEIAATPVRFPEKAPEMPDIRTASASHPGVRILREEAALARSSVSLEESLAVPDVTVAAGHVGFGGYAESALLLSVSIPIPLFDQNRRAVDESRAEVRRAHAAVNATVAQIESALRVAHLRLAAQWSRCRQVRDVLVPAAEESHRRVTEGFELGRYSTLDILESARALLAVRREKLEAFEQYDVLAVRLAYLHGTLVPTTQENVHE